MQRQTYGSVTIHTTPEKVRVFQHDEFLGYTPLELPLAPSPELLLRDLAGTGVRVTSIEPGMVETEFTLVRTGSQEASDKLYAGVNPMTAEDIAERVSGVDDVQNNLKVNRSGAVNDQTAVSSSTPTPSI